MASIYDNYTNHSLTPMTTRYPLMSNIGDFQQSDYAKFVEAGKQNNSVTSIYEGFDDLPISASKQENEATRPVVNNAAGQWNSNNINMYLGTHLASADLSQSIHPLYYGTSNISHQSHNSGGSILSLSSTMSVSNSLRKIAKPRVATTYWESENTTCFQVQARNVVVSRRENDDYVNGTKLLNVTGMTRGKRDGLLKTEKGRVVIRNGPMNLKGVWIPFKRAAEIARNEGVDKLLYPLFVNQIRDFFQEQGQELRQEPSLDTETELISASQPFVKNDLTDIGKSENEPTPFYFP